MERENQSKLSLLNGELQRRKEEIDNVENQYNKQWVVLKNQDKEIQKRKYELSALRDENEILMAKNDKLKSVFENEVEALESEQRYVSFIPRLCFCDYIFCKKEGVGFCLLINLCSLNMNSYRL